MENPIEATATCRPSLADKAPFRVGGIICAAGASSRLGQPKQLLVWRGLSLIRRAALAAQESPCQAVAVVIGAAADLVRPELDNTGVMIVENKHWPEGLASSLRAGLQALLAAADDWDAAIVALCDQPLVTSEHWNRLIDAHLRTAKPIVASCYRGTLGVPALFASRFFPDLMALSADEGAKRIIAAHGDATEAVDFPGGELDVDRAVDYERLCQAAVPHQRFDPT